MNVENESPLRRSSRIDAKKASQNEESNFERRLNVEGTSQCLQNNDKSNFERRQNVTNNVVKMGRRQIEKRPKKRRQLRTMTTIHFRPDFAQRETVEVRG